MQIKKLIVGPVATCCYLLWEDGRDDCLIIDPGAEPKRIREAAGGRKIAGILLTHGHFDHIDAVGELMAADTVLAIHSQDAPMLTDPALNAGLSLMRALVTAPEANRLLAEGDRFSPAGLEIAVLHTPGHTPGSCCFRIGNGLFTGDTLFRMGCGRTDLPGGSEEQMETSLRRLCDLLKREPMPIYPGH